MSIFVFLFGSSIYDYFKLGCYFTSSTAIAEGNIISFNGTENYDISLSNLSYIGIKVLNTPAHVRLSLLNSNYTLGCPNTQYLKLNRGAYKFIFYTNATPVSVLINVKPTIVNPFSNTNKSASYPIGITNLGYFYSNFTSGKPHPIKTQQVGGYSTIYLINAYNAFPPKNISKYGASLQLNTMMQVTTNNTINSYWLQDFIQINTSNMSYRYDANIWNTSSTNANVIGLDGGYINIDVKTNKKYYVYTSNYQKYTYPFNFSPIINLSRIDKHLSVNFGYIQAGNIIYYNRAIFVSSTGSSYILMTPFYMTNSLKYYDSEFVFGGAGNLEQTTFNNLNANLTIYYIENGTQKTFPTALTFGLDTGEVSNGIKVSQGNHVARITNGIPNLTDIIYFNNSGRQ